MSGIEVSRGSDIQPSAETLLEAIFADYVYTKRTVFVAQRDDGKIGTHGVFNLDDLLLGGVDVCAVSDGEVTSKLLLDRYTRAGIRTGGSGGKV